MKKNNFLFIVRGYYPSIRYGGPPISVMNLVDNIVEYFNIYIITNDKEKGSKLRHKNIKDGWNVFNRYKIMYLDDKHYSFTFLNKIVDEVSPNIIYINSFFEFRLLIYLGHISKINNIPLLIAPRGQLLKNALRFKSIKKTLFIKFFVFFLPKKNIFFQATSSEEFKQIKSLLNPRNKLFLLDNIPSNFTFNPKPSYKIENELKIVFYSRIHPKKNIIFAIDILQKISGNIIFDIYGYIESNAYWDKVKSASKSLPNNIKINYKGELTREQIPKTLSKYNLFFLPTLSENYGHVISEALFANLPVLLSDQTPWFPNSNYDILWAYPLSDKNQFINKIQELVYLDQKEYIELHLKVENYYRIHIKSNKINLYLEAFKEMVSKNYEY